MCSENISDTIDIVGGTYHERCSEPVWREIYGSGLRAAYTIRALTDCCYIKLHTVADNYVKRHLDMHCPSLQIDLDVLEISNSICFNYHHALKPPFVHDVQKVVDSINVNGENCVVFGMLETNTTVCAKRIVYDPQSPTNPSLLSSSGSKADHVALVMNYQEASLLANSSNIDEIRGYLFTQENCECLVLKMGPMGARVFANRDSKGQNVPVYKTDFVWSIGSGDVFTAVFGYYWMIEGLDPFQSAMKASIGAASYCNSKRLDGLKHNIENCPFVPIQPGDHGKVYLAGPFFTMAQRTFIDECYRALKGIGLDVFSPFHDVGIGEAKEVVPKDIEALDECKVVYAVLDGMDPGTVFEVGYAVALQKKVVLHAQNEHPTHLQMMVGTGCSIEKDFVTSIYKTYWCANE